MITSYWLSREFSSEKEGWRGYDAIITGVKGVKL